MNIPGHRTTLHIIDGEAYHRIMSGMAPDTLDQFAAQLLDGSTRAIPAQRL